MRSVDVDDAWVLMEAGSVERVWEWVVILAYCGVACFVETLLLDAQPATKMSAASAMYFTII